MDNKSESLEQVIGYVGPKTKEDMAIEATGNGFSQASCPHDACDGSGIIVVEQDGRQFAKDCQCLKDSIQIKRLTRFGLDPQFYGSTYAFDEERTTITHFKPLLTPKPYKGADEKKEKPEGWIKRHYDAKPYPHGVGSFGQKYTEKTLEWLDEFPRTQTMNLLLFGESGCGKTHLANVIGADYASRGKTVHFSTMQDLLDKVYQKEITLKEISRTVDLLIIDEIYNEYHTDTEWALKNIKEMLKIRAKEQLPIICTSNGYPHEFSRLYGKSVMSMFNGTFFVMFMEREGDQRIEQIHERFKAFDL